jgi:hypothetical protein
MDRLLVAAIWPGDAPAAFRSLDGCPTRSRDAGCNLFAVSPGLDRTNYTGLCDRRRRLIGAIRFRISVNYA